MYSAILDHRFFIRHDFDHPLRVNSFFQTNPINRENLINQFLMYDNVIISTKDFGIVPILINWMGMNTFLEAIDEGIFSFVHHKAILGYGGNGIGISSFEITEGDRGPFEWWNDAMWRESDVAIEQQLKHMCPFLSQKERSKIQSKILVRIKELGYENDFFMKNIVHESYTDIMENDDLWKMVIRNDASGYSGKIDLTRLGETGNSFMKVLNQEGKIENSTDLVLRVAEINMEIFVSSLFDEVDFFTSTGAEGILRGKLKRTNVSEIYRENFLSLLELVRVPNVGQAVIREVVSFKDFWKIRQSWKSKRFRSWLRRSNTENVGELQKMFLDTLRKKSWAESLPIKISRFCITGVIDVANPVIGGMVNVADNFFVDKLAKGYLPILFLDEISNLFYKNKK